ncbi:hypothetical protein JQ621_13015 [Bradyrhizobium manausense]|uniref:hypothetical protein n=1 Tax=Bradyrhizobium manausense TaxID=989370 RepID=UPI001BADAF61|nr:hypothetical protein [Bradyrhizobium manausense]MBR1088385.1 hypothetical protein [Bradyrhizobium manausense]
MGKDTRAPWALQARDDTPPGGLGSHISDVRRFAVLPGRRPDGVCLHAGRSGGHDVESFERSNEIVIKPDGLGRRPELEAITGDQQQGHDDETDRAACQGDGRRDHGAILGRIVAELSGQEH